MKKLVLLLTILASSFIMGCSHALRITNESDYFTPSSASLPAPITLGITSRSDTHMQNSKYVNAIVDALQRTGSFTRVIRPYDAAHRDQVAAVVDITVNPRYSGSGTNFFVNFPGFLIWAPAIWGYGYVAEIETTATIKKKDSSTQQIAIPTKYYFRQAEIDRTWTEISWFEVGVIALIGGIVFTQYDDDVTDEFITKVSANYGPHVGSKIVDALR